MAGKSIKRQQRATTTRRRPSRASPSQSPLPSTSPAWRTSRVPGPGRPLQGHGRRRDGPCLWPHGTSSRRLAIPPPASPSGKTEANLKSAVAGETRTSTRRCTPAWPRPRATRVSPRWRVVRDAGQSREVARGPLRQGAEADRGQRSRRGYLVVFLVWGARRDRAVPPGDEARMTLDIRQPDFWKLDCRRSRASPRLRHLQRRCRRCLPSVPPSRCCSTGSMSTRWTATWRSFPPRTLKEVVDLCYQCKLCYNHCPYTPPHRWQVDFPRLMLRSRSAEARAKGVTLQDRFLGNTELVGSWVA